MKKIGSVEEYIESHEQFSNGLVILRDIINSTELEETVKWSMPTYCINAKNVLSIGAFKHHFCIWFHQGVFLEDKQQLLISAEKTKGMRQMRFSSKEDISKHTVLAYVQEAIENQKLGKELKPVKTISKKEIIVPEEFQKLLNNNKKLQTCFKALTPFKQREYSEYIANAKRDATKQTRIEKIIPMIINGVGLNDKYKK